MRDRSGFFDRIKSNLLYGGIGKAEYDQVKGPIAEANKKSLERWSVLVSLFWIYCLVMSIWAADYAMCRPAYTAALAMCVFSYISSRIIVKRFPKTISAFMFIFRLSLLFGGVGIAVCQWNLRSLTLFAVAIILPSIFIDRTLSSIAVHCSALVFYILLGRNIILPEIYSWGLGNFILFSVFGILIGNAINRERFERYVYMDSEKKLVYIQMRYAYYDPMTELKNRRAYEEKLNGLKTDAPFEFCVVMIDINRLKETNDTIGHSAGDELIIGTSECLTSAFGGIDTIYRIGGDEFSVVLVGSLEQAQACLDELDKMVSEWKGRYINGISVSTGVASNKEFDDLESITAEADRRMYECKRNYYMNSGVDRRKR